MYRVDKKLKKLKKEPAFRYKAELKPITEMGRAAIFNTPDVRSFTIVEIYDDEGTLSESERKKKAVEVARSREIEMGLPGRGGFGAYKGLNVRGGRSAFSMVNRKLTHLVPEFGKDYEIEVTNIGIEEKQNVEEQIQNIPDLRNGNAKGKQQKALNK